MPDGRCKSTMKYEKYTEIYMYIWGYKIAMDFCVFIYISLSWFSQISIFFWLAKQELVWNTYQQNEKKTTEYESHAIYASNSLINSEMQSLSSSTFLRANDTPANFVVSQFFSRQN